MQQLLACVSVADTVHACRRRHQGATLKLHGVHDEPFGVLVAVDGWPDEIGDRRSF